MADPSSPPLSDDGQGCLQDRVAVWLGHAYPTPPAPERMAESAAEGALELLEFVPGYKASSPEQVREFRYRLGKARVQLMALAEHLGVDAEECDRETFYGLLQYQGGPGNTIPWKRATDA